MLLVLGLLAAGINALPSDSVLKRQFPRPYAPPGASSPPEWNQSGPGYKPPGSTSSLSSGSPPYTWIFDFPLPIPSLAEPVMTETIDGRTIEYYESTIEAYQQQVYPNLGPANLVGYNGTSPGATFRIKRGTESIVRYLNNGYTNSSVHLHGSSTHAVWDGWASDVIGIGQYKDYYYPNSETARPMWYHDHANGHTAADAYYGQAGCYIIYDPDEDFLGLPSGNYDVPLAISDKTYQSNGDLASPSGDTSNFYGDTIHVNEQPWPFFAVEPRKYRLRFFDMSLSRPYQMYFADENNDWIWFEMIASDSGLFSHPVHSNNFTISMGERYEVIFDFSGFKNQNITLMNAFQIPAVEDFANTDKVMRFVVGDTVTDSTNNGAVPSTLNPNIQWPGQRTIVDHTFNFQQGGDAEWTINGVDFNDVNNRVLAKPSQGATELWQINHAGGDAIHPVHIHLVNLQVISRTGGSRGLQPYEAAGLKDVVMLEPGESIQVLAVYGPWNGMFMFHCHNLIHEDNAMLDVFNSTLLEELGYTFHDTQQYADPTDPRFAPRMYSAAAYSPDAVSSAIASLASPNPYAQASALSAAESSFYAMATGIPGGAQPTSTFFVADGGSSVPASSAPIATPPSSPTNSTSYTLTTRAAIETGSAAAWSWHE